MLDAFNETSLSGESLSSPGLMVFERVMHYKSGAGKEDALKRMESGDLRAHFWLPQAQQIFNGYTSRYGKAPSMLAIDSMYPIAIPHISPEVNKRNWFLQPDRPKNINPQGYLALAGDPDIGQRPELLTVLTKEEIDAMYGPVDLNPLVDFLAKMSVGIGGATIIDTLIHKKQTMSRRDFLKAVTLGLSAGFLVQTAGILATYLRGYTTAPETQKVLDFVSGITNWDIVPSVWLDGRTAVVISKTEEALTKLQYENVLIEPYPVASILFGSSHEEKGLIDNKASRITCIQRYREAMIIAAEHAAQTLYPNALLKQADVVNGVNDFISSTTIYKVTDDTSIADYSPGFEQKLPNMIQPLYTYKSEAILNT